MKKSINHFSLRYLLAVFLIITFQVNYGQSGYIKKYRSLSDELYAKYGIPASVILGIAIIESSQGKSRNCKLLNNHFGIIGKNNLWKTKKIRTRYKQYPDSKASFADFCSIISGKRFYKKLKGNMNYRLWLNAISKSAYSEAPSLWVRRISLAIKKNKLYRL